MVTTQPIIDLTRLVNVKKAKSLELERLRFLAFHRISLAKKTDTNPHPVPDDQLDGEDIIRYHEGLPSYHVFIGKRIIRGDVVAFRQQLLPLRYRGAHMMGFNAKSWAIACAGDFRTETMPSSMLALLTQTVLELRPFNDYLGLVGHTDYPNTSQWPNHQCPGKHFPMAELEKITNAYSLLRIGNYVL